ncbi:hypothetical protein [Leucobacter tenebrionis]|uniref:hypothetical protein n=1 Tax=Leucobacter tenebrionis TaxID=2873270 RepID=UPI001CA72108|nr:hypothetical protein [Leucobacter tenebrionis]QZY51409.1 hypothetical protein KVY00_12655 [Leucobacter tenebrionis]
MPIILVILLVMLVVFVIRLVIGFIMHPVATIAKLGSLVCNLIGLMALAVLFLGIALLMGWAESSEGAFTENLLITIGAGVVMVVAFGLSSVLSRARRRAELRREYADHYAVAQQMERRFDR